ncbi:MAG: PIN domain-containing protein [Pyrinomonadaceae bacterium]
MIVLDSSILIDLFRKKRKERSAFFKLTERNFSFSISVITLFEIFNGCSDEVQAYWRELVGEFNILPLTAELNKRHFERISVLTIFKEGG